MTIQHFPFSSLCLTPYSVFRNQRIMALTMTLGTVAMILRIIYSEGMTIQNAIQRLLFLYNTVTTIGLKIILAQYFTEKGFGGGEGRNASRGI